MAAKMCNDCRWCGSGLFLLSPDHRKCYHPIVVEKASRRHPAGSGNAYVGIERGWSGECGHEGKFWNSDKSGNRANV